MPSFDFNIGLSSLPELETQNEELQRLIQEFIKVYNAINVLAQEIQTIKDRLAAAGIP